MGSDLFELVLDLFGIQIAIADVEVVLVFEIDFASVMEDVVNNSELHEKTLGNVGICFCQGVIRRVLALFVE